MANVTITEYRGIGSVDPGSLSDSYEVNAQAPLGDGTQINQPLMTVAGQSAAFDRKTRLVRVHTDAPIKIYVGGISPAATVNSDRMAANQTEYWAVRSGDKLAWIVSA